MFIIIYNRTFSKATRLVEKTISHLKYNYVETKMSLIFMILTLLVAVAVGHSQEEFAETCPLWMTERGGECLYREFSFIGEAMTLASIT